jgi:putative membrane protein
MRRLMVAVGLIAGMTIAMGAAAQQSSTVPLSADVPGGGTAPATVPAATAAPIAVSNNLFEIESSRLALQRSQSPAVKEFANRMVAEHTRAGSKLKAALHDANLPIPPEQLSAKDQSVYDSLNATQGAAFDKAFVEAQYNAHVEAVNLFRAYSERGDNAHLKELSARYLPTLEGRLQQISNLRTP